MKISINWLKDYINLRETPQKIADALTMGIAEVEGIEEAGKMFDNIIVGSVKRISRHPNADKLSLAEVSLGNKMVKIICGAENLQTGQKVPVATLSAVLPNGMKIEKVKIRGELSEGMICSESELGLAKKSSGIMVLRQGARVGQKFSEYLGLSDSILDIDNKSLTHRSDLFGHIGIARELSAILKRKLALPEKPKITKAEEKEKIKVTVADKKLCPRYMAVALDGIEIKESPQWMQNRLNACGIRPINNIVDVTNYILLEWGQPLHAFDGDKLAANEGSERHINVRLAKDGEKIKTIDGQQRKLNKSMLVIADSKKPIAIAGIMGGADTEVDESTKRIVLESANFHPSSVRKTANSLGLRTEAVTRFEKGLSVIFPKEGLYRAIDFLQKYANARVSSMVVDTMRREPKRKSIRLDMEYLNKLVGVDIPRTQVISILKSLEFKTAATGKDLTVQPPLHRTDINISEDLIEEVARIYGYGNIKPEEIVGVLKPIIEKPDIYWGNKITEILVGAGLVETQNYSFYGEKLLRKSLLSSKDHIEIENPISEDLSYLRTTLLPGLFATADKNIRNYEKFKLFEIGHVYFEKCECKSLAGIIVGDDSNIFFDVKGLIELLLEKLHIEFEAKELARNNSCEYWNMYLRGRSLEFKSGKDILGTISLADPKILKNFHIKKKQMAFFSFSIDQLAAKASNIAKYKPLPKYPKVMLDLAVVLDKKIRAENVAREIFKAGRPLIVDVELFDVYAGKQLAPRERSLAYHLVFQAEDRTLKDEEIKKFRKRIIQNLAENFGAKVRE